MESFSAWTNTNTNIKKTKKKMKHKIQTNSVYVECCTKTNQKRFNKEQNSNPNWGQKQRLAGYIYERSRGLKRNVPLVHANEANTSSKLEQLIHVSTVIVCNKTSHT